MSKELEDEVKGLLLKRGFSREVILCNRGLIGATIEDATEVNRERSCKVDDNSKICHTCDTSLNDRLSSNTFCHNCIHEAPTNTEVNRERTYKVDDNGVKMDEPTLSGTILDGVEKYEYLNALTAEEYIKKQNEKIAELEGQLEHLGFEGNEMSYKLMTTYEELKTRSESLSQSQSDLKESKQEVERLREGMIEISNNIGKGNLSLGDCQLRILKLIK